MGGGGEGASAHFKTFKVVKAWHGHIFLVVFLKSKFMKNAVSERWCMDSRLSFKLKNFHAFAFFVKKSQFKSDLNKIESLRILLLHSH